MTEQTEIAGRIIPARTVRELCGGVSDMSLYRWLNNERLDFPPPIYIQKRRYWREAEIHDWIERRSEAAV